MGCLWVSSTFSSQILVTNVPPFCYHRSLADGWARVIRETLQLHHSGQTKALESDSWHIALLTTYFHTKNINPFLQANRNDKCARHSTKLFIVMMMYCSSVRILHWNRGVWSNFLTAHSHHLTTEIADASGSRSQNPTTKLIPIAQCFQTYWKCPVKLTQQSWQQSYHDLSVWHMAGAWIDAHTSKAQPISQSHVAAAILSKQSTWP